MSVEGLNPERSSTCTDDMQVKTCKKRGLQTECLSWHALQTSSYTSAHPSATVRSLRNTRREGGCPKHLRKRGSTAQCARTTSTNCGAVWGDYLRNKNEKP